MALFIDKLKNILKKITKMSRPSFVLNDDKLIFKINSDFFYEYELKNMEIKTRHDPYVNEAYTLKTKDIYLEYINTRHDICWNSLALSHFIELLKRDLKVKSFQLVEEKEFRSFSFYTYKVNSNFYLNLIYIYEINKEIFIVDVSSDLYVNLLKQFENNYLYTFEQNKDKDTSFLNFSLTKENMIMNYFSLDKD